VLLACCALIAGSCSRTHAALAADNAIGIDLGPVPSHAEIHRIVPLPDSLHGHSFIGLQSSCGCVSPGILASGSELAPGQVFPSSGPLSLRVQFRPRVSSGPDTETVRIRYKAQDSEEEKAQALRFSCVLDPALSQLEKREAINIQAEAPVQKLEQSLVLRRPVSTDTLRKLNPKLPGWLGLALGDEPTVSSIAIVLQDLVVVRDSQTQLRIPFAEGVSELVPLRVHLQARAKLVPGSVTESVRLGSKLELPVHMKGGSFGQESGDLLLHDLHEVGGDPSKKGSLPTILLGIDKTPASPTAGQLILKASGFLRPGAFEAEVLVRPQGKTYQLPLPVFFRITGEE